jgi:hypothetical protein
MKFSCGRQVKNGVGKRIRRKELKLGKKNEVAIVAELTSQSNSIQSLYSMYREEKIFVNRRYQRKLVWTLEEKQRLVESILKKYPIPAVLIAERDDAPGSYEIIDGLQRLQAILSYIEMSFPTLDGKLFDVTRFPTAKKASEDGRFPIKLDAPLLGASEVSVFLDYSIALSVMRNATEAEINDVFDRINTYGHRLSDQERRQAGVQNAFSEMVRTISCTIRGDGSATILPLHAMHSISIDLPKTKHGYQIQAEDVFWVRHGILRSTDLRDSMDEQCIADIAASAISGSCLERSKDALDSVYDVRHKESERIETSLKVYGTERFAKEFSFCIDEIIKVCSDGQEELLRNIIFESRTSNAYPSVFAIVFLAFYELLVKKNLKISNYLEVKKLMRALSRRIETGQKGASPEERRKNIDQVKGLIQGVFIPNDKNPRSYAGNTIPDIDVTIRRSSIELANYELKQGLTSIAGKRKIEKNILAKIINTIAAIANNGPDSSGTILIGVADKEEDVEKIQSLDGIKAHVVGSRYVVGVSREAKALGLSLEAYVTKVRDEIRSSGLSDSIKSSVLSRIDFHDYYGLGLIVIEVPNQHELAFVGDDVYWRAGDQTMKATDAKTIANIARRF